MYRDDDFVLDNFSQLLNQTQEYDDSTTTTTTIQIQEENELPKHQGKKSAKKKTANTINLQRLLEEFEEAFSALKSIQAAHSPISHTAMVAFLHQIRGGSKVYQFAIFTQFLMFVETRELSTDSFGLNTDKVSRIADSCRNPSLASKKSTLPLRIKRFLNTKY